MFGDPRLQWRRQGRGGDGIGAPDLAAAVVVRRHNKSGERTIAAPEAEVKPQLRGGRFDTRPEQRATT
jgi:hypothetical protein